MIDRAEFQFGFSQKSKGFVKIPQLLLISMLKKCWCSLGRQDRIIIVLLHLALTCFFCFFFPATCVYWSLGSAVFQILSYTKAFLTRGESTRHQAHRSGILTWCDDNNVMWLLFDTEAHWTPNFKIEAMTFTRWQKTELWSCRWWICARRFKLSFHTTNKSLMFVYISPSPVDHSRALVVFQGDW